MASSGKKGKKVKGKTLGLQEFLGDTPVMPQPQSKSWADFEVEDKITPSVKMSLPTAPRAARGTDVDETLIPRDGPYIGYISNLLFDMEESDIQDFFGDLNVVSIRLPRDDRSGGKLKGFGYVEFADRAGLIGALQLNETVIKGRRVRIEVSDSSNRDMRRGGMNRDRDRGESNYDPERTMGDWRSGPRPESSSDRGPRRDFGMRDNDRDRERDRDRDRERDRDAVDSGGNWRDAPRKMMEERDNRDSRDSRDGRSYDRPSMGSGGPRRFGDRDRERRDASPPPEGRTRPKLNLKPRSIPVEAANAAESSGTDGEEKPQPASKSSIFGDAKPVDTASRERQLERNGVEPAKDEGKEDTAEEPVVSKPAKPAANPFGGAKPVDTSAREREIEENSRAKAEPAAPPPARAAKPTAASIFGAAKPVDTATREREIEERLAKERQSGSAAEPGKTKIETRERSAERKDDKTEKSDKPETAPPVENAWPRRTQPRSTSPSRVSRDSPPPRERKDDRDNHADRHHPRKDDRSHRDSDHPKRDDRPRREDRDRRDGERDRERRPPEKSNPDDKEKSRVNTAKERPPREPRPMPKASEASAPNYVAPNKYSFLEEDAPAE